MSTTKDFKTYVTPETEAFQAGKTGLVIKIKVVPLCGLNLLTLITLHYCSYNFALKQMGDTEIEISDL